MSSRSIRKASLVRKGVAEEFEHDYYPTGVRPETKSVVKSKEFHFVLVFKNPPSK
jgi:hypothetical protein